MISLVVSITFSNQFIASSESGETWVRVHGSLATRKLVLASFPGNLELRAHLLEYLNSLFDDMN